MIPAGIIFVSTALNTQATNTPYTKELIIVITLDEAIVVATTAHMGQVDKLGHPYILHPIRVMMTFRHHEFDERIVALFHDVLEDTDMPVGALMEILTIEQVEAIKALTHGKNEPREQYIKRIMKNKLALRVKIADINDNLDRVEYLPVETQNRLREKYAKDLNLIYSA